MMICGVPTHKSDLRFVMSTQMVESALKAQCSKTADAELSLAAAEQALKQRESALESVRLGEASAKQALASKSEELEELSRLNQELMARMRADKREAEKREVALGELARNVQDLEVRACALATAAKRWRHRYLHKRLSCLSSTLCGLLLTGSEQAA